eukprot:Gregarina_sp_Poly_1__9149@NODE_561_length_7528_cov_34_720949_g441_i0_p1_GENE_NODE_561_length_7528_cov_34_720949_g441_i0NODE_561_length_7528_cov_34_720949_g441_i0_p1_ORF_typecomplete_len800_score83_02_NODE_561_length_7528_cov_34_720949_g441_i08463245
MGRRTSFNSYIDSVSKRRLSFTQDGLEATVPKTSREGQNFDILTQATEAVSETVWELLSEVLGQSACEEALRRRFRALSGTEIADGEGVAAQFLDASNRKDLCSRVLLALDALVSQITANQSEISNFSVLKSLGVVRETAVLIELYSQLWLEDAGDTAEVDGVCIPHMRKWCLLQWGSRADSGFDPVHEYEIALATIVAAERKMITLAQINRPFVISGQRRSEVCRTICRLYLFGYWDAALNLLKRCYSHTDEALVELEQLIRKHFPSSQFDLGDVDSLRHPFRRPANLHQFRLDVRNNIVSQIKITDDHLLRDILIITATVDDEDDDDSCLLSQGVGTFSQKEDDLPPYEAACRRVFVGDGSPQLMAWFTVHLFWLAGLYEPACVAASPELVDANAIAYLFQRWWHDRGFHEVPFSIGDVACALVLGNNLDWLQAHLVQYRMCFLPLTAPLLSLLVFFDFPISLQQIPNTLMDSLMDYANIIGDANTVPYYNPAHEISFIKGTKSIALFINAYGPLEAANRAQRLNPNDTIPHRIFLSALATPVHWICFQLVVFLVVPRPQEAMQYLFDKIQQAWESPINVDMQLFLACLATEIVSEALRLMDIDLPMDTNGSAIPLWTEEILKFIDEQFSRAQSINGDLTYLQCLQKHPPLIHRIECLLQSAVYPLRLLELAVIAHFEWITHSSVQGYCIEEERAQCFCNAWKLLEHLTAAQSKINTVRLWTLIEVMLDKKLVTYSKAEAQVMVSRFEKCVDTSQLDEEGILGRLRTLRSLLNGFADPSSANLRDGLIEGSTPIIRC